ncbi:nuclear fragile X mental retardation-interacting protein 1 [Entomortierella parvispora]|uniref:Nuclear fragile X mental retardation-interacting protein 1 n=1 Tax=Entomortierella parvispora TaxID=205924 RepID=A0A9P3H9Y5_9FUNG|nr:nuclear fragile X mental retardation-interacting protein 1 [Entomortierella parvispora]
MDQYYQQQGQKGRQGQQPQGQQAGQGPQGQQWQYQQQHPGYAQQYYGQQLQQYPQQYNAAAHQAYYDQYQQYYAQQQYQQHQPQAHAGATSNATLAALASALPPSYDTPLPTARSKPGSSSANQASNNPLAQIQAQYQSSMQLGAAAASAATAALFKSGFATQTDTTSASGSAASTTLPGIATSDPVLNDKKRKIDPGASSVETDTDWYSTYKTPSAQERKAALSATPSHRPALPPKPQVTMNGPKNNRNQRGGKQGNHCGRQEKQTKTAEVQEDSDSGFHCDACDVTFHEEAKLKVHIAAHRSCPDCAYKASPSLVREHQKLTHGAQKDEDETEGSTAATAVARKLDPAPARQGPLGGKKQQMSSQNLIHPLAPKLNTPEDIAAWIAQRRKQWPTETNIQKKEQERQEMIAKGQIVEDPTKGKNAFDKKGKGNNNSNKKLSWKQRQEEARAQKRIKMEAGETAEGAVPSTVDGSIVPALGPSEIGDGEEDDDEDMDPEKDAITSKDPTVMGKVLLPTERATRPKRACRYFLKGTCHKGDKCSWSHDAALAAKVQKSVQASVKTEVFRTRSSLLQMLLSGEIKQEKNVLLEAIRFIVDNNFFEKEEPTGALVQELVAENGMDLSS